MSLEKIQLILREDGIFGLIEKFCAVVQKYLFTAYYRFRFSSLGIKSFVTGPIQIQGGKRIAIDNHVVIGAGCLFRTTNNGTIQIGANCVIDRNVTLISEGNLVIEDGVKIFNNSKITAGKEVILQKNAWIARECTIGGNNIVIEENVIFGPSVYIMAGDHKIDSLSGRILMQSGEVAPIRIKSNAWLGLRSVILKGVTVGRGAIVGAASVVTKDIPDFTVAVGVPAKPIKSTIVSLKY